MRGHLIDQDMTGKWRLIGMDWEQISPGTTITKPVSDILYMALCKLRDYESTGLSPCEVERVNDVIQDQSEELNKEQKKHRWIPIEKQVPESNDYILLSFSNWSLPEIGRYETDKDGGGSFYIDDDEITCRELNLIVNAWMPLPKPYQKKERP